MTNPDVGQFNHLDTDQAKAQLRRCLDVTRWVDEVSTGRPYADWADLEAAAQRSGARLNSKELEQALAGHPRIGEKVSTPQHDAEFSEREQSGVDPADAEVAQALANGNRAYEQRFDRVFLIRAAGRSADQILTELNRRLANDDDTERHEVVAQLTQIAVLRLKEAI